MAQTAAGTQTRFALDEDRARQWLQASAGDSLSTPYDPGRAPAIDPDWQPRGDSEGNAVWELVSHAATAGIITSPGGARVDFSYCEDSDGPVYRWLVFPDSDLELTTAADDIGFIGDYDNHDLSGFDAAISVLREAVQQGNVMLGHLDAYIARLPR